jgi:twitching motility protein PilJ
MLTQRLGKSANEFLTPDGINPDTAFLLGRDANTFQDIITAFLEGSPVLRLPASTHPDARRKLLELQESYAGYRSALQGILAKLKQFIAAKEAERLIFSENENLRTRFLDLQQAYRVQAGDDFGVHRALPWTAAATLMLAMSVVLLLLYEGRLQTARAESQRQEAERQRLRAEREETNARQINQKNQEAILRLMNELQAVAEGDLSTQTTVSEDITGAIADSINLTLEDLCLLLNQVRQTVEHVASACATARDISGDLLSLADQQSEDIQQTGSVVLQMTEQIHQVSRAAKESAEVAQSSVQAARQGEHAVQEAIGSMQRLREQVQETAKRVKRVGESSLEIGDITELIAEITEQTHMLALNASIQAASAGEAGRGFAVIAEEVQRLAERSGDAARQVSQLVRTVQTDAQEAVSAMERSTQSVVDSARRTDAAGVALADILRVAAHLEELNQAISDSASTQSGLAQEVASHIESMLTITEHTRQGTQMTSSSVQELAGLAEQLSQAVARFRIAR